MGLKKEIVLANGITVNYHRIVSINNIINEGTIIEVASYTGENKRKEEKNAILNSRIIDEENNTKELDEVNVFINTIYINKEYTQNITIEEAYEYLKTLEDFKNAIDN